MTRARSTLCWLLLISSQGACFHYQDRAVSDASTDEEPCPDSVPFGDLCWDARLGEQPMLWKRQPMSTRWVFEPRMGWQFKAKADQPPPSEEYQLIREGIMRLCAPGEKRQLSCRFAQQLEGTLPYRLKILDGQDQTKFWFQLSGPAKIPGAEDLTVQLSTTTDMDGFSIRFTIGTKSMNSGPVEGLWTIRRLHCQTQCIASGAQPTRIAERTP